MKIDLSPEVKKEPPAISGILKRGILGILVSLSAVLAMNFYYDINLKYEENRILQLQEKHQAYLKSETQMQEIKKDVEYLDKKISAFNNLLPRRFYWSEKLLSLARIIPEEIWLRKLSIERKDSREMLKLRGFLFTLRADERPISVLNNFIKALKADKSFFGDFSNMSLVDTRMTSVKNRNVLEFNMELSVKE